MMADAADSATLTWWSPDVVASMTKSDGSSVTKADVAAECAVLEVVIDACSGDGFIGEELGERIGSVQLRWVVDGIDGTRNFTHGLRNWGTLTALEDHGGIVIGVASSPAQNRRWWARHGEGVSTG
jgi:histidinol-phosphatase